jgi:hypothetical protein
VAPLVGDVAKVEDERRDRLGRGEADPRSEAVDERFFKLGIDLRPSSLRELALGMRRGVECCGVWLTPERAGGSAGDKSEEESPDGEVGSGVAARDG